MPDEAQAPAPITGENPAEQDAPESAAPSEGLPAESEATAQDAPDTTDYRKRYEDLHPQLTKAPPPWIARIHAGLRR